MSDTTRKVTLSVIITGGYSDTAYKSEQTIAEIRPPEGGPQTDAEQVSLLTALSMPMSKIAAGGVLEGLSFIEKRQKEIDEDKANKDYAIVINLVAKMGVYGTAEVQLADFKMAGHFAILDNMDCEIVAVGMESISMAIAAMVVDLLVANKLMRPAPELVVGEEAETIAGLLTEGYSAADAASQINRACEMYSRETSDLARARHRLEELAQQIVGLAIEDAGKAACPVADNPYETDEKPE